jgi:hypothetical protein
MRFKQLKAVQLLGVLALVLAVLFYLGTAFSKKPILEPADKLLVLSR